MPRPRLELPMTMDDFRIMPHRLGYKHEYWDGKARLSFSHSAIVYWRRATDILIEPSARVIVADDTYEVTSPVAADRDDLIDLHLRAFDDSLDYLGYPEEVYRTSIAKDIDHFLGRKSSGDVSWLNDSSVVRFGRKIVGAALLAPTHFPQRGVTLQPVMTHPDHVRRGLATGLLRRTVDRLSRGGVPELLSSSSLGNPASLAWHRAMGFEEVPHSATTGHRAMHHRWMAGHHEAAGRDVEARRHRELAAGQSALHRRLREEELEAFRSHRDE